MKKRRRKPPNTLKGRTFTQEEADAFPRHASFAAAHAQNTGDGETTHRRFDRSPTERVARCGPC